MKQQKNIIDPSIRAELLASRPDSLDFCGGSQDKVPILYEFYNREDSRAETALGVKLQQRLPAFDRLDL